MTTGSIPFCNQCRHYVAEDKTCRNLLSIVDGSFAPASFARVDANAGNFPTYAVVGSLPMQAVICGRSGGWFAEGDTE